MSNRPKPGVAFEFEGNCILDVLAFGEYGMADRPALPEIEITPEMYDAGVEAASLFDSRDSLDVVLPIIFEAMLRASPYMPPAPSPEPLSDRAAVRASSEFG